MNTETPELQDKPEDTSPLEYLVRHLRLAKTEEENVKAKRIMIEEKIAGLIPGPERGQKTIKLTDGSSVTVERGLLYTANCQAIEQAFSAAGKVHVPIKVKTTRELDEVGYNWILENDNESKELLSGLVTVKPKKTSVSIKDKK